MKLVLCLAAALAAASASPVAIGHPGESPERWADTRSVLPAALAPKKPVPLGSPARRDAGPAFLVAIGTKKQNVGELTGLALYTEIIKGLNDLCRDSEDAGRCDESRKIRIDNIAGEFFTAGSLELSAENTHWVPDVHGGIKEFFITKIADVLQLASEASSSCAVTPAGCPTRGCLPEQRLCSVPDTVSVRVENIPKPARIDARLTFHAEPVEGREGVPAQEDFQCKAILAQVKEDLNHIRSDPLGSDPRGRRRDPLASDPLGSDPLGSDPLGRDPFGSDPLGRDPLRSDPFGKLPKARGNQPHVAVRCGDEDAADN